MMTAFPKFAIAKWQHILEYIIFSCERSGNSVGMSDDMITCENCTEAFTQKNTTTIKTKWRQFGGRITTSGVGRAVEAWRG